MSIASSSGPGSQATVNRRPAPLGRGSGPVNQRGRREWHGECQHRLRLHGPGRRRRPGARHALLVRLRDARTASGPGRPHAHAARHGCRPPALRGRLVREVQLGLLQRLRPTRRARRPELRAPPGRLHLRGSQKPPASQTPGADIGRPFDPLHECKTLDDYRQRYAQYRSDPDTQALHHAHALLATLDDHEFADGAWRGGADEHKPERDGPWETRRAAAFRARSRVAADAPA